MHEPANNWATTIYKRCFPRKHPLPLHCKKLYKVKGVRKGVDKVLFIMTISVIGGKGLKGSRNVA